MHAHLNSSRIGPRSNILHQIRRSSVALRRQGFHSPSPHNSLNFGNCNYERVYYRPPYLNALSSPLIKFVVSNSL
ncbi:hypothetical protein JTE90_019565 [Oedothorax gibbosus]|uniref:Uncharacterized protein n=1 Tax=Oedothorax gibbosus TaxID=931172 RepID=A0AAV6V777_9ARAC|nr:hypothetical protein JTE90_019565 [Oedothorax gibbosus]